MAKKINYPIALESYDPPPVSDNNPDGVCKIPNTSIRGYGYDDGTNRLCLPERVAKGESPIKPNVYVSNVDGTNYAFCEGNNYEWDGDKRRDGRWNFNRPWLGGNRGGE